MVNGPVRMRLGHLEAENVRNAVRDRLRTGVPEFGGRGWIEDILLLGEEFTRGSRSADLVQCCLGRLEIHLQVAVALMTVFDDDFGGNDVLRLKIGLVPSGTDVS